MKIAIIGAGSVGIALGSGWTKAGHEITYGVRDPQSDKIRELRAGLPSAGFASMAEAARDAEVVTLCTPWPATEAAVRACGPLAGKIVIDVTNPVKPDLSGLELGLTTSAGEKVAQWATGAEVYKTMNQVGSGLMDHPQLNAASKPAMFVAGDGAGKTKVLQLVTDLGFEAIDAGTLEMARLLEPLAMLWIRLAIFQKQGPGFAFGLLRK